GSAIFATNAVAPSIFCPDPTGTTNPDAAFADPTYSHADFVIGPGNHSLTFQPYVNRFVAGVNNTGFFRVDPLSTVANALEIVREMLAAGQISATEAADLDQSLIVAAAAAPPFVSNAPGTPGFSAAQQKSLFCETLKCALCI